MIGLIYFIHVRAFYLIQSFLWPLSSKNHFQVIFISPTVIFLLNIWNYFRKEKFTFLCRRRNVSDADKEEKLPWMSGARSCDQRCVVGMGRGVGKCGGKGTKDSQCVRMLEERWRSSTMWMCRSGQDTPFMRKRFHNDQEMSQCKREHPGWNSSPKIGQ